MKQVLFLISLFTSAQLFSQDVAALMEEGKKLEQKHNEPEAFEKYREVTKADPTNLAAFVKLAELSCSIGARQKDPVEKGKYFLDAKSFADAARNQDSTSAEGMYVTALVYEKLSEMEEKKEAYAEDVKLTKYYAEKAIAADPKLGRAYNVLGRWHYELLNLNPFKKAALKVLYGGLPPANIDSSIAYLEKCKSLEQYYCQNFLDLGKAYNFNRNYEKAIDVLKQLARLPTRRQDDPAIKAEGAVLLQKLQ